MSERFFLWLSFFVFLLGIISLFVLTLVIDSSSVFSSNSSSVNSSFINSCLPEDRFISLPVTVISQSASSKGTVFTFSFNSSFRAFLDNSLNQSLEGKEVLVKGLYDGSWFNIDSIIIS